MKQWYVVQTKPQKENPVSQLLGQGGFEVFLPKIRLVSFQRPRSSGSVSVEKVKPLFPSYLFVRCDFAERDNLRMLRYTRGIQKIIGSEGGPVPLADKVISVIKEKLGSNGFIDPRESLKPGDKIVVKRGILKDLMGILEKPADDKGRVDVLLKIIHRQMKARLYCSDIEPV